MIRKTGLVWLLLLFCTAVRASNLRQISSREGISNNAILSLAQDKHGFIWVGSCDGLNMWDGERMRLFPNDWGGETPLSGNLIEEIAVTTDSLFWIRTNYGLDLFDPDSKRVERHADFQGMYKIVTRRSDEVLVVTQDNKFSCYDPTARRFSSVQPMPGIDYADILDMQLDDDGALWVFSRKGIFRIPVAFPDKNNDRIGIGRPERFPTVSNPEYAFAENGSGFFIDEKHIFYEFDIRERRLIYIKEMSDEMARMGSVSSIVRDGGDYIVSFYTNGVIRLRTTPEQSVKYATEHINIPCGVFSLLRDARQEIVWIGTDGQGLYQHTRNATAFRSITFNQLPYNLSKPVRALYIDDERTLWVGTKGEGILRIADFYDRKEFTPAHVQQLTADNSELLDNSVYAFARSRRNLLWIGTDGEGLNYYSYGDRRIRTNYTKVNCTRLIRMLTPYLVDEDPALRQMAQQLTAYYRDQSGKGWVDEVEELPVPAETPIQRRGPEKVVVLTDTWCEQEAERFVQLAKQQGRAVLLGRPTMGTLDYTNPVMVEYDEFIFTYPISRTAASLEGEGVDERGVQPDVLVPWTPEECTADLLAQKALTL